MKQSTVKATTMHQASQKHVNPQKISLTLFSAHRPRVVTKSLELSEDGTLQKLPGGKIIEAIAERQRVTISDFCVLLSKLKPNQALSFGVTGPERALVVPKDAIEKRAGGSIPVIARTREYFSWLSDHGILMLDYDPPKGSRPLTREEVLDMLYIVWPELKGAPHVWFPSASSCIYRKDTGEELRGIAGQRVYVPVVNAQDIPRVGGALYGRLWLNGHGRFDISASGAFLDRSLIDASVWQPERLDFAAGAACGPGLEQRRGHPLIINPEKPFIDSSTLPDLDPQEKTELERLKTAAKESRQPDSLAKHDEWIEERLATCQETKKAGMREILTRAVKDKRLLGDFVLHLEKHGKVSVATILDNPGKYHGARCCDPLEPDYGNDHRIAWINLKAAGKPYVWSHAHGGQCFTLHRAINTIRIQGGEHQNITLKLLELMRLDCAVFAREGELVRLNDGMAYPVGPDWLRWYLTGLSRFEKFDKRSERWEARDCPPDVARSLCALQGHWNLPLLKGLLTAPTITPTGRVIQEDGFDEQTGLYLHFPSSESWEGIPEKPSLEATKSAVACLWRPFQEFPFVSAVDRGGFLAALLTALVRPLLPTAPGFLISAPVAGSGKTLLALCVAALAGATIGVSSAGRDEEELEKRLLTELRFFARLVILDNVARPLESEALCAFLTSPHYSGRLLGSNLNIAGRPVAVVILTGNNPTIIGDLNRRLLRIVIDPRCEKPHDRRFDLDPLSYVQAHRPKLVEAGLLILKAALACGLKHDRGRLASFEVWSDFIRNAVIWIGENKWLEVADPVLSIDEGFDNDPLTTRLKALLEIWFKTFPSGATVVKAIRSSKKNDHLYEILEECAGERGQIPPRRLGNWIAKHEGRILNGMRFARLGNHDRAVVWVVQGMSLNEFQSSFWPTREKCQTDNFIERGENTPQTQSNSSTCAACVNFNPSTINPNGHGICEHSSDGRLSKMPGDGADCCAFERITH